MPSVFFKIGTTDLTSYVDKQNCNVNEEDMFEEWRDGNWNTHRVSVRKRRVGTIQLGFKSTSDFSTFVGLLTSQRNANGYYPVTVYINNKGTTDTFNAFIDTTNESKWDILNTHQWQVQNLTITEV